ncbi:MAG: AraC family transcriptional regulator [Clostridia bacterium]|nr:AraC family transcriptional regulator [Clostridia bacterium]
MRQFFIDTLPEINPNFKFINYERYRYADHEGFTAQMHYNTYTELFFITDGKGFFYTNEKKIPVEKGDVVINNANMMCAESPAPGCELEYAVIQIDNFSVTEKKSEEVINCFVINLKKDFEILFDFIRKIEYEWIVKDNYWNYAIQINLEEMLLFVLRNSELFSKNASPFAKRHSLAEIYEYLTSRYQQDITLAGICSHFKVNKYTISHAFKEEYGDSIINTLNRIRCKIASALLKETDKSVSVISSEVGFNSEPYFCKTYKKYMGVSPLETRKMFLEMKKSTTRIDGADGDLPK